MTGPMIKLVERGKLRFSGEQALWFLDQLVTNRFEGLAADSSLETLLLTPNGKITAYMRCHHANDAVYADVDPEKIDDLIEFFRTRVFTTKVEIDDVTKEYEIIEVFNYDNLSPPANGFVANLERPKGQVIWGHPDEMLEQQQRLLAEGAGVLDEPTYDNLRVNAGAPRFGVDYDETYIVQEAAMERIVAYDKGCYLGQEAVAKAQRGKPSRRLRWLRAEGPLKVGPVTLEGKDVGRVTSAGSVSVTESRAIATIKTHVAVGSVVESSGLQATLEELPGTDEGPSVPSARELREKLGPMARK